MWKERNFFSFVKSMIGQIIFFMVKLFLLTFLANITRSHLLPCSLSPRCHPTFRVAQPPLSEHFLGSAVSKETNFTHLRARSHGSLQGLSNTKVFNGRLMDLLAPGIGWAVGVLIKSPKIYPEVNSPHTLHLNYWRDLYNLLLLYTLWGRFPLIGCFLLLIPPLIRQLFNIFFLKFTKIMTTNMWKCG